MAPSSVIRTFCKRPYVTWFSALSHTAPEHRQGGWFWVLADGMGSRKFQENVQMTVIYGQPLPQTGDFVRTDGGFRFFPGPLDPRRPFFPPDRHKMSGSRTDIGARFCRTAGQVCSGAPILPDTSHSLAPIQLDTPLVATSHRTRYHDNDNTHEQYHSATTQLLRCRLERERSRSLRKGGQSHEHYPSSGSGEYPRFASI